MARPDVPRGWLPDAAERAVFAAGVASIGLEILGGRLLAPTFGGSVYTWGSTIGVTLGALALGYHLGGRRAAARASRTALARILLAAAAFVALLLAVDDLVLVVADGLPLGPRLAPLPPVAVLLGPPVFVLGVVSPYAAELSRLESTGGASGRVYALGTLGSLVGAFATTFLLLPATDVPTLELGFGLLLVVAAVLTLPWRDREPVDVANVGAVVVLLVGASVAAGPAVQLPGETVYSTQTEYQRLTVAEADGVRTLYLDGHPQSATYVDGREGYVYEYSRYLHLPMLVADDVDRVLFVGGGGFTAPTRYLAAYPDVTVDVVELDPAVVRAARTYFGVPDSPRLNVVVGDGREYLERTDRTYDVVVLDAFRADKVPAHLATVEFLRLVRSRLDADGVVVSNLVSAASGPASRLYRAEFETMRQVFDGVAAFPTRDPAATALQNVELLAVRSGATLSESLLQRRARTRDVGVDLRDAVGNYRGPAAVPTDDVPVLRDGDALTRLLDPQLGRSYLLGNETAG